MAAWKDKLSFLSPTCITHEINGSNVNFYPISLGLAFRLRTVAKPLVLAIQTLFATDKNDTGSTQKTTKRGEDSYDSETILAPITPELAALRSKQTADAVASLVDSILGDENLKIVGEILMDSMRDHFPPGNRDNPPPSEFIKEIEPSTAVQMLMGVLKANKGVFGPLERAMSGWTEKIKQKVESRLGGVASESISPPPSPVAATVPTLVG